MEKTGFIYIWYDRKRKMYYVGCHWGTMNDGYVCSSNRMRDAYRRRPQDFKRRILKTGIMQTSLLEEEYKWLQMIKSEEIGKRYYNLYQRHFGHWANIDNEQKKSIRQKMSETRKDRPQSEEHKKSIAAALKGKKYPNRKKSILTDEHKQKISEGRKGMIFSKEHREKLSKARKGMEFPNRRRPKSRTL